MCSEEIWDRLYGSIVLSGGSTMLSVFGERMEKEMRKLAPSSREIKILAHQRGIMPPGSGVLSSHQSAHSRKFVSSGLLSSQSRFIIE